MNKKTGLTVGLGGDAANAIQEVLDFILKVQLGLGGAFEWEPSGKN